MTFMRSISTFALTAGLAAILSACAPQPGPGPDTGPAGLERSVTNVRSRPTSKSARVTALPTGTQVVVLDTSGNWKLVQTDAGVRGWVYDRYLGPRRASRPAAGRGTVGRRPTAPSPAPEPAPAPEADVVVDVRAADPDADAPAEGAAALPGE